MEVVLISLGDKGRQVSSSPLNLELMKGHCWNDFPVLSRGTSTGWRKGLTGTAWSSARGRASPAPGRSNPMCRDRLGANPWEAVLQKMLWGSWWTPS